MDIVFEPLGKFIIQELQKIQSRKFVFSDWSIEVCQNKNVLASGFLDFIANLAKKPTQAIHNNKYSLNIPLKEV